MALRLRQAEGPHVRRQIIEQHAERIDVGTGLRAVLHHLLGRDIGAGAHGHAELLLQQIGQELHDNVGQLLTLARLHLGSAENLSESPEAAGKVRQANEVLKTTIQAVRALSKTLDADTVAQHGLAESLRLECDRISRLGTVAVRFESTRLPDELPPQAQLVVFRMAQEVLNNALKHADAQTLTVTMTLLEGRLLLDLADDGQGFSPDEAAARSLDAGGSGLRNLRRRAELLGGTFALTSQPGQGTQVRIAVPVT